MSKGQVGEDQGFDLAPDCGVVLDFDVAFGEGAGDPGVARGGDVVVFVAEVDVAEDFGGCGVGGADDGAAVEEALGLVEVDGLGDVGGDEAIVGSRLATPSTWAMRRTGTPSCWS